jgi:hypothetical protein
MSKIQQNFAQYLRALQIMFFALFAGSTIVLIMFYFMAPDGSESLSGDGFIMYIPLVMLTLIAGAFYLGRNRIEAARQLRDLKQKMTAYRAALILRWALIEGSVLMTSVFFFLTRDIQLLIVAGVGIVIFALFFPSRERIITDLELSGSEQAALDDPNFIVAEVDYRGK